MSRTLLAVLLVFALSAPDRLLAGPPDQASSRMVFVDRVANGLRQVRAESDPSKRIDLMMSLFPTRDPRVAVAFGEMMEQSRSERSNSYPDPGTAAETLLHVHYYSEEPGGARGAFEWWQTNKDDLRRRAKLLPK